MLHRITTKHIFCQILGQCVLSLGLQIGCMLKSFLSTLIIGFCNCNVSSFNKIKSVRPYLTSRELKVIIGTFS